MGVTGNINDQYNAQIVEDELRIIEDQITQEAPKSPKRAHKKRRPFSVIADRSQPSPKSGQGVRQKRRAENLNYLLELGEKEDLLEVDLTEHNLSAFGELLSEVEKMKIWNDFVNHTEEEQQKFLQTLHYESENIDEKNGKSQEEDPADDKRTVHPAFSAKQCFERIDSRLQSFLRKKRLPKGMLEYLEEDVTSFFTDWPGSVYVSHLSSSFERMMLHALCQYMDLSSFSFDEDGVRNTQVENLQELFLAPEIGLSQYIVEL